MAPVSFFAILRTRLNLLVLLLVIPAFGLVLYGNLEQRRIEKARVREGVAAISQLAAANQENFIKNSRQLLATLAQFPFLVLATNRPFCETHFSNLRLLAPDYLDFGLIETDGTLFCSATVTNRSVNLADRSFFQRVIQTKLFSIGDFQVDQDGPAGAEFWLPGARRAGNAQAGSVCFLETVPVVGGSRTRWSSFGRGADCG